MNDEELRDALADIRRVADVALGEAIVGTLLVRPLLQVLEQSGIFPKGASAALIDGALLAAEEFDALMPDLGRLASDHAQARLRSLLTDYEPSPSVPPATATRRRRGPRKS